MLSRFPFSVVRDERDRGFTLIELLVVVIIVGVLAAIAIPVFLNQRKKAVDASIKADVKNVATVVESVAADKPQSMNAYSTAELVAAGAKVTAGNTVWVSGRPATGFCVGGRNPGWSAGGADVWMLYDSLEGGLRATLVTRSSTGACTAAATNGTGYASLS